MAWSIVRPSHFAQNFAEAVALLGHAAGREFAFADQAPEAHVGRLRACGTPEGYVTWRMAMLGGIRSGADPYVSDGVPWVLGRPATSVSPRLLPRVRR